MPRKSVNGRVGFSTRLRPEAIGALVDRAIARYGRRNSVNLIIEDVVMSRPFEPTPVQADDPLLRACWHERDTEAQAIERCRVELAALRRQLQERDAEIAQLRGDQ